MLRLDDGNGCCMDRRGGAVRSWLSANMAPGIKVPGGQWLVFGGESWKTTVASVPIAEVQTLEKRTFKV